MRVLFINPKGSMRTEPWMPLGAVSLATLLARKHDVVFADEERRSVKPDVVEDADVVCITGMSHQAVGIEMWAERARMQGKRVLVGGVHATLSARGLRSVVRVIGPGERVIEEMVDRPWKFSGEHRTAPLRDPDLYPWPDRARFGWRDYGEQVDGLPAIRVIGARGCPFMCRYCCNRTLTGGKMNHRSPELIEREIAEAKKRLGIKAVVFAMSNFTTNGRWVEDMCDRLGRLVVRWKATTRVDLVNRRTIRTMKKGGCVSLGFGVESGDDGVLKIMGKGTTVAQARKALALCKEEGLRTWAMFMTHSPGETPETLRKTRKFAEEIQSSAGVGACTFQRFSPLEGSGFWGDGLKQWGRVTDERQPGGFGSVGFVPAAFAGEEAG